jgi:Type I phosphodiesterase / nucleotide pyrophosphatase
MAVYWMVWDAAAAWVVDRLVSQGRLPAVAALREAGLRAQARPPAPNCQTPPSLATLFTGTSPERHGVTGFWVPAGGGCHPLSQTPAFTPGVCREPMVWDRLGEAGLRSAFVHVPWVFDGSGAVPGYVDAAVEMFSRRRARPGVFELPVRGARSVWQIAGHELVVEVLDPETVRVGPLTLCRAAGWQPLRLPDGVTPMVSLFEVQGRLRLAHTGAWQERCAGEDSSLVGALRAEGASIGEGLGAEYREGRLGNRMAEGGDGTAEAVFSSSLRCVSYSFARMTRTMIQGHRADLVVIYLPMTDEVGHELLGWCDETSEAYRPDLASRAWSMVADCYRQADDILASVLAKATPRDTVVLSADHGMAGVGATFYPNAALVRAGLAVPDEDPDAGADTSRSDVLYHRAGNGLLTVNRSDYPGGRVSSADAPRVLGRAIVVLGQVVHPRTGRPVLRAVVDVAGHPIDLESASEAYLVLDGEILPSPDVPEDLSIFGPPLRNAAHTINNGDPRLLATMAAAGPGLGRGGDLGVIDNAEVASLVLAQLASSAPAPSGRETKVGL